LKASRATTAWAWARWRSTTSAASAGPARACSTGKLNKLTLTIDRPKLTPEDEKRLMQAQRKRWMVRVVATQKMERTLPLILQWDENLDIGADTGTPVDDKDYQVPFKFRASE